MAKFERRECKRVAHCRWCDQTIEKGEEMVTGYSWRNRGMNIHFCLPCAYLVGRLADGET